MGAPEAYVREVRSELGLHPTWFPTDPVALGDFGRMRGGRLIREGNLEDLGISFTPRVHARGSGFRKSKGVTMALQGGARGESDLVDASAGIELVLVREHAWVMVCKDDQLCEIDDLFDVKNAILAARRTQSGQWDDAFVVVTALRRVRALTVIIARSAGARAMAVAEGSVAEPTDILLSADLRLTHSASDMLVIREASRETTPLYDVRRIRRGIFRDGLVPMNAGGTEDWGLPLVTDARELAGEAGEPVDWPPSRQEPEGRG
ncbi:MAG: hypothetical protein JNL38_07665 [Myxococcales bacterium]|jgi:hypothetical protein|nr:hypothetical protein [Myxococcales bacterium]